MKRPNWLLFITVGFLVKIYAFLKGQRIKRTVRIKGPSIVLSNHTSFYDFIYTSAAIYPYRVNYMAASKMFYDPVMGFFLRLVRAFPKALFQSDPVATLNTFRLLKKKGIVSIFPEGQISPIGVTQEINFSIAKLLKKAKVDVYLVKHKGAYLVNPPWNKKTFHGRVETTVDLLLSKSDLASLSESLIYEKVVDGLAFNTSEYNESKKHKYHKNTIENLESVIYLCPNCGYEQLKSNPHHLVCESCGNEMEYDSIGQLGNVRIDLLYRAQEKKMEDIILNSPEFQLKSNVILESYNNNLLEVVGKGELTLSKAGYVYEGTMHEEAVHLEFDPSIIPTLPSDLGRNIQIYQGYIIYQFVFEDVNLPTKFVIAGEIIHKLSISDKL
ncbi:MAG: 1-acyl-sn-glycerol-3-phosphate acyltransferase [Firmicutes bacterium]|nr:1-acyl-sn-glycerol-3-phosphate acyltransferase [Bacillota bacterium]